MTTARCRTLSSKVGIPRGRVSLPVPFGMYTRRTGVPRYVTDLALSLQRFHDEAPPSLPRIPSSTVLLVPWYYEVLRRPASLSPRLVAFAWRYLPVRLSSSLPHGPTPAGGLELSGLAAPRQLFRTG